MCLPHELSRRVSSLYTGHAADTCRQAEQTSNFGARLARPTQVTRVPLRQARRQTQHARTSPAGSATLGRRAQPAPRLAHGAAAQADRLQHCRVQGSNVAISQQQYCSPAHPHSSPAFASATRAVMRQPAPAALPAPLQATACDRRAACTQSPHSDEVRDVHRLRSVHTARSRHARHGCRCWCTAAWGNPQCCRIAAPTGKHGCMHVVGGYQTCMRLQGTMQSESWVGGAAAGRAISSICVE